MISALAVILLGLSLSQRSSFTSTDNTPINTVPAESAVIEAVKSTIPSVVTIALKNGINTNNIGSGFIVSSDGLIITNKHVVADVASDYSVITNNNETFDVVNIYRDPLNDLAIMKIDATSLKPAVLGDSSSIQLGQTAITIGTPLGEFRNTVTSGVISGLSRGVSANSPYMRSVEQLNNVIQTDAPISPGNSGGPLINSNGQVIGVNTAVSVAGSNIGFAIPVNVVKDLINAFESGGQNFQQPYLGVRYVMIDQTQASMTGSVAGAYVVEVVPNSPAANANIQRNDIITSFAGQSLQDKDLSTLILQQKIDNQVPVEVYRDGQSTTLQVTLKKAP